MTYIHPVGNIVMGASVALLVEHFQYLTKNQLVLLGPNHVVDFLNGA